MKKVFTAIPLLFALLLTRTGGVKLNGSRSANSKGMAVQTV